MQAFLVVLYGNEFDCEAHLNLTFDAFVQFFQATEQRLYVHCRMRLNSFSRTLLFLFKSECLAAK